MFLRLKISGREKKKPKLKWPNSEASVKKKKKSEIQVPI